MNNRQKFQVWSEAQQRWKTCYILPAMLGMTPPRA